MSTPADKVLRKFENKINLGEFVKYIWALRKFFRNLSVIKMLLNQEMRVFSVAD